MQLLWVDPSEKKPWYICAVLRKTKTLKSLSSKAYTQSTQIILRPPGLAKVRDGERGTATGGLPKREWGQGNSWKERTVRELWVQVSCSEALGQLKNYANYSIRQTLNEPLRHFLYYCALSSYSEVVKASFEALRVSQVLNSHPAICNRLTEVPQALISFWTPKNLSSVVTSAKAAVTCHSLPRPPSQHPTNSSLMRLSLLQSNSASSPPCLCWQPNGSSSWGASMTPYFTWPLRDSGCDPQSWILSKPADDAYYGGGERSTHCFRNAYPLPSNSFLQSILCF